MSYYVEIDKEPCCISNNVRGYFPDAQCAYSRREDAADFAESLQEQNPHSVVEVIEGPCPGHEREQEMAQEHSDALEAIAASIRERGITVDQKYLDKARALVGEVVVGAIVMHGNISKGFEAFGPFDDFAAAVAWIDKEACLQFETRVIPLRRPRTIAEVLARTRDPEERLMDAQDVEQEMREARGEDRD